MSVNFQRKVTPETIQLLHDILPPHASTTSIRAAALLTELSYSTVWHIVRFYCRHHDAAWHNIPMLLPEEDEA